MAPGPRLQKAAPVPRPGASSEGCIGPSAFGLEALGTGDLGPHGLVLASCHRPVTPQSC